MTVSTNLGLLQVSESQSAKATAANTSIGQLEAAISDEYSLNTSAATSSGHNVTIPFTTTNDLSDRQATRLVRLILAAGATANFNVIHPDNKHLFLCSNVTTQPATVKTLAGTGVLVGAGRARILYCDGVNVVDALNLPHYYDLQFTFAGLPTAAQVLHQRIVSKATLFPANLAGAAGNIGVNPTATYQLTVKAAGVAIGTVTVSTAGVFTFATTSGIAQSVAAGSMVTVEAPTPADATAATLTIAIPVSD